MHLKRTGTIGSRVDDPERGLAKIVRDHAREFRNERMVLYAGASLLTDSQKRISGIDLSALPAMGRLETKEQPGADTVAELERWMSDLASEMFGVGWADLRLPSCTIANLAIYSFLAKAGDLLLAPAARDGGHLSQRRGGTPSILGIDVQDLPFDGAMQCLDEARAANMIRSMRPRLVMLGRSVILGPDSLARVIEASRSVGALTIYDASHVSGLIASGVFDNPMSHGIDVMTSSTYKTLGGPAGGMVLFRDPDLGRAFSQHVDSAFLANQNASRFPAIISAIWSCRPETHYGTKVLKTTDVMKVSFASRGIAVLLPGSPARSHQVVAPIGSLEHARSVMKSLEAAGILVGTCPIPGTEAKFGLRFGSHIMASLGVGQGEVEVVISLVADILHQTEWGARTLDSSDLRCRNSRSTIRRLLKSTPGIVR